MSEITKQFTELRQFIKESADRVTEGELNPFEIGREIAYTKNCLEQAKETITDSEKAEYSKYSPAELKEMKIQLAGGGYTYKFDHIPEWVKLNDQIKVIEEQAKKAFLMSLQGELVAVEATGEQRIPAVGNPKRQSVSYR